jgi:hypothetical protein
MAFFMAIPALAQDSGWIGIQIEDQKDRGAFIRRVEPNSPAEKAGLKDGDVVLEFNKEPVIGVQQLTRLIRETPSGRTIDMKVHRDNRDETVKVTITVTGGQDGNSETVTVPMANDDEYAKTLAPEDFQTVTFSGTGKTRVRSRFAFKRVTAAHPVTRDRVAPREEWLIIEWPHGIEVVAATTPEICRLSAAALQTGKWQPIGEPAPPVSTSPASSARSAPEISKAPRSTSCPKTSWAACARAYARPKFCASRLACAMRRKANQSGSGCCSGTLPTGF